MHHWEKALSFTRARLAIALVAIFAFGLQAYVVQTHIHAPGGLAQAMGQTAAKAPQGDKPQDKDNPDDCPICQAFALTGAFVKPLTAVLFLALTFVAATPFLATAGTTAPFFARQGLSRAPPRR